MKAFVTGGSGFVGQNLIKGLVAEGHTVRALARSGAAADAVQRAGAEPVFGDLNDPETLRKAVEGSDVVFHCAALIAFWNREKELEQINVQGTRNILAAARDARVPRFVHISAVAVLSTGGAIMNTEETRPLPRNPFGGYIRTKAISEKLVLEANATDFATMAIRPHMIWGIGDERFLPGVIKLVRDRMFFFINRGQYPFATCHVRNVCEGAILAAEKGRGGQTYFLTDGPPIMFRTFVSDLLRTQGIDPGTRSIPRQFALVAAFLAKVIWRALGLRGKPPLTREELALIAFPITVSDKKARQELGYSSHVTREEGLAELSNLAGIMRK